MKLINGSVFKSNTKSYIVTGIRKTKLIGGEIVGLEFREQTDEPTEQIDLTGDKLQTFLERLKEGIYNQIS